MKNWKAIVGVIAIFILGGLAGSITTRLNQTCVSTSSSIQKSPSAPFPQPLPTQPLSKILAPPEHLSLVPLQILLPALPFPIPAAIQNT